ncbi:hypothetical protein CPB84DRAFT_1851170 [Gymnopilus junonius]|uniref:Uncharacterized protein n=1 Tax=Gymnopilus junonius TaxID=109634 RepID=A0A9P5NEY2_GYMJU|nr:hypothetical protein CPB84DRAFT_1851170 [Gymnopilus junonius]
MQADFAVAQHAKPGMDFREDMTNPEFLAPKSTPAAGPATLLTSTQEKGKSVPDRKLFPQPSFAPAATKTLPAPAAVLTTANGAQPDEAAANSEDGMEIDAVQGQTGHKVFRHAPHPTPAQFQMMQLSAPVVEETVIVHSIAAAPAGLPSMTTIVATASNAEEAIADVPATSSPTQPNPEDGLATSSPGFIWIAPMNLLSLPDNLHPHY